MDLELSDEQQQLERALAGFFDRHAGVARAQELGGRFDAELTAELDRSGFLDTARDGGPIEAVLVVEQATEALACAPVAGRALVAPLAGLHDLPPAIGLIGSPGGLVRFAGSCDAYVGFDADGRGFVAAADAVEVTPVESPSGYPLGRVRVRDAETLAPETGDALRRAWQTELAAEIGSLTLSAVLFSADHVRERHQFGRSMGSFQAVQHRLATCFSMAHATRWLARRAAWQNDDEFITASAATFACETAQRTYDNTHQVTGAIGITDEYGLTHRTTRLLVLARELGGARSHSRRVSAARRAALA